MTRLTTILASLCLFGCSSYPEQLPPPPAEPRVILDNPTCVSCGGLLTESELSTLTAKAQQGSADAAFRVAYHYNSADAPETYKQWILRAATLGHSTAQYNAWFILSQSSNCADRSAALGWLVKAAASGQTNAVKALPAFRSQANDCKATP